MKKTLIALAVAASAAVSGSAMAWTANGSGGSVDLSGTLTPVEKVTPWEVKTGAAVTDLNAQVQKGQKEVSIYVNKAIPVLGIRTQNGVVFRGEQGISPQIDYGSAVDVETFNLGKTTLTLDVNETTGNTKIGTMTADFSAAAIANKSDRNVGLFAASSGDAFFGGLGKNASGVLNYANARSLLQQINPTVLDKYVYATNDSPYSDNTQFSDTAEQYSGAYTSGIESGKFIKITLDQPAGADGIAWKASLPVIVTYM